MSLLRRGGGQKHSQWARVYWGYVKQKLTDTEMTFFLHRGRFWDRLRCLHTLFQRTGCQFDWLRDVRVQVREKEIAGRLVGSREKGRWGIKVGKSARAVGGKVRKDSMGEGERVRSWSAVKDCSYSSLWSIPADLMSHATLQWGQCHAISQVYSALLRPCSAGNRGLVVPGLHSVKLNKRKEWTVMPLLVQCQIKYVINMLNLNGWNQNKH